MVEISSRDVRKERWRVRGKGGEKEEREGEKRENGSEEQGTRAQRRRDKEARMAEGKAGEGGQKKVRQVYDFLFLIPLKSNLPSKHLCCLGTGAQ